MDHYITIPRCNDEMQPIDCSANRVEVMNTVILYCVVPLITVMPSLSPSNGVQKHEENEK